MSQVMTCVEGRGVGPFVPLTFVTSHLCLSDESQVRHDPDRAGSRLTPQRQPSSRWSRLVGSCPLYSVGPGLYLTLSRIPGLAYRFGPFRTSERRSHAIERLQGTAVIPSECPQSRLRSRGSGPVGHDRAGRVHTEQG